MRKRMEPLSDFPQSFNSFQKMFSSDETCRNYLLRYRWPLGFLCMRCSSTDYWHLVRHPTLRCAQCGYEDSLIAGTVMQDTRTPLRLWFWSAYLFSSTHQYLSPGELQHRLALKHYATAFNLLHKLRAVVAKPEKVKMSGVIELDMTCPTRPQGSINAASAPLGTTIVGAYKLIQERHDTRGPTQDQLRLGVIPDHTSESLAAFVKANVRDNAVIISGEDSCSENP